ncbi:MAG: Rpn family recombination-promoting nuclease/putative transposase [Lachnospiraceae bacterium]|nr:Rpn family recombination-promoting nuclease/putative transposase [Lachnospiraceae bacterium]
MRNKKLCQKLLEVILNVKISKIEYVKEQVSLTGKPDSKSVRLDVYVSDDAGTVYDVEMQTGNTRNLPKRSRYYQSIIDINLLMKGSGYQSLRKSYVIFICTFDPFGAGRHIYRFGNRCLEDDRIILGDEAIKVFLNPKSDMNDIDADLKNFLTYLADAIACDSFTQELADEVEKIKTDKELEVEYMTLLMLEQEKYEEGLEDGLQKGRREGLLDALVNLVRDGLLSAADAAKRADMSEDAFKNLIK